MDGPLMSMLSLHRFLRAVGSLLLLLLCTNSFVPAFSQNIPEQQPPTAAAETPVTETPAADTLMMPLLTADTLLIDTLTLKQQLGFLPKHSPAKATLMSTVLPGLGQYYNKKYWKIPVVYAAIGTSAYFYVKFRNEFEKYRQAYVDLMDGDESTRSYERFDIPQGVTTERFLTVYRDNNRRYRDWWLIGLALSYSLNIIDAVVDAHFFDFNVDENLTLRVEPHYMPEMMKQNRQIGVNLKFYF